MTIGVEIEPLPADIAPSGNIRDLRRWFYASYVVELAPGIGYFVNAYLRELVERHRLATLPERNPNPVLSLDCDGGLIRANQGTRKWLGDNRFAADDFSALLNEGRRLPAAGNQPEAVAA